MLSRSASATGDSELAARVDGCQPARQLGVHQVGRGNYATHSIAVKSRARS